MAQVNKAGQDKRDATRTARAAGAGKGDWKGFVGCELTQDDKAAIREFSNRYGDAWTHVMGRVFAGYKLGVSYDNGNNSYNVSLTCWRSSDANNGWCLSARGGSVQSAVIALWYKDEILLEGAWAKAGRTHQAKFDEFDVG